MTTSAATDVWEIRGERITHSEIAPEDVGLERVAVEALAGGTASDNAQIVQDVLRGASGPIRDAVILNAAAGLTALDVHADGHVADRLKSNMAKASQSIDSGAAAETLRRWVDFTSG